MLKYSHKNSKIAVRGLNFRISFFGGRSGGGGGAVAQGVLLEKRGLLFSEGGGVQLSHNKLKSGLMRKKVDEQKYFSL